MMEKTLLLIKPDGIKRGLVGEIVKRIEDSGLKITAMKMTRASRKFAERHYPKTNSQLVGMGAKTLKAAREVGALKEIKKIFGTGDPKKIGLVLRKRLVVYLVSAPVIAMVVEGKNAVKKIRKISGYTDPAKARKGTIRGDFGKDSIIKANRERRTTRNLVHAAGSKKEAKKEIRFWFKSKEIY